MATARKYAGLPDLDQAPDVYETPDLADDVSTIPTSARSPSVDSDDGRTHDDDEESGVVKSKVNRDQAFSRFENSRVDARKADFSDKLNGSRQYYKTFNRRRRKASYVNGDSGDISGYDEPSDSEEETLDRKIARLKREIEEARVELAEKDEDRELFSDAPESRQDGDGGDHMLESIDKLNEALNAIDVSKSGIRKDPAAGLSEAVANFTMGAAEIVRDGTQDLSLPTFKASSAEHQAQLSQALAKAAEFDTRLSFLEQALGLVDDGMLSQDGGGRQNPILYTLRTIDQQVHSLTNSSASIDAASGKTRKLIEQAEQLLKVKSEYNALDHPTTEDLDNVSRLNALHGTLSTIDALAPTLPLVLDRLRTLRLLHTSAAGAGNTLDEIEKRQAEQANELKQWREALDQVEQNIKSSEAGLVDNVQSVERWVKDLEARLANMS